MRSKLGQTRFAQTVSQFWTTPISPNQVSLSILQNRPPPYVSPAGISRRELEIVCLRYSLIIGTVHLYLLLVYHNLSICFIVCTAWTAETLLAIFGGSVVTLSFGKYALWANCRTVWASASLRNLRMILADFQGLRVTSSRKLSQKSFCGSCVPIPAKKHPAITNMWQQDAPYNQSFSASSTFIR